MGEHLPCKQKGVGSSPITSTSLIGEGMRKTSRKWGIEFQLSCADKADIPFTEVSALMYELILKLKQKGFQVTFTGPTDVELKENKGR